MLRNWLTTINYAVGALASLFLIAAFGFTLARPSEIIASSEIVKKSSIPKGAFALSKEAYDAIGEPLLSLQFTPVGMQLPDLRKDLIFYGNNGRPDAQIDIPQLHFSFNGNSNINSLAPEQRFYVSYDRSLSPPQYVFSENNQKTPLWIEVKNDGADALVHVSMQSDNGILIQDPPLYSKFNIKPREYIKTVASASKPTEVGKWKIDGSLLARQKARWYGIDRFLEKHGGEEFSLLQNKHRIDFGENESIYSVFIGPGDCLIWNNDRWNSVSPGPDSIGYPLLVLKKADDRLMNFEIWDPEGKSKVVLNLLKSTEPWASRNLENTFQFMGARTRSQFVFEVDNERILLRPHDWLVQTENGWIKLSTPEQIDAYVERKISGPLFVFDGIVRKDDKQVLIGTMFNPSRTEMQQIEVAIHQGGASCTPQEVERRNDSEDNTIDNPVAQYKLPNYKS